MIKAISTRLACAFFMMTAISFSAAANESDEPLFWLDQAVVEYNNSNAPASQTLTESMIDYAVWSWKQRTGMRIRNAGLTDSLGDVYSGKVTVRWSDQEEINEIGGNSETIARTQYYWYKDTFQLSGAIVHLNKAMYNELSNKCWMTAVLHEMGHAFGITGHSDDPEAIMHATQEHCNYALTTADFNMVRAKRKTCHAELTAEGDIAIPYIDGYAAYLTMVGEYRWKLEKLVPAAEGCASVEVDQESNLIFSDLRSVKSNLYVELKSLGNDEWELLYAK